MDKISVTLYGGKGLFGGKESPLRAEEIYCDKYQNCSLFKNNCCLKIRNVCKFGEIKKIKGYTSRAKKYYNFKEKYKYDEKYNKLTVPKNCKLALIDNYIYIDVQYAKIEYDKDKDKYYVDEIGFRNAGSWIELSKFNCDLLYEICNFKAIAIMGGEIAFYKKESIPNMLFQLKKLLPRLYSDFISKYPKYDINPTYIGKIAYVKTLTKDTILIDCHGNKFLFDGDYLICKEWKLSFIPFDAKIAEIRIKVTNDMKYKIDNNSQVNDNTIFEQ